ncbi:MAG: M48 family metallopeptidase, partial [Limosilactobacillus sp.]|nr:M48 family metallopeptidase [Limosilactobacillus sp.]
MIDSLVIRHNKRTTHLRLSINKKGMPVLTVPLFCSEKKALQWAESHGQWIERHRFIPTTFTPNQTLLLCGQNVTLIHAPEQNLNERRGDKIYIGGEISHFNRRVHTFIKRALLSYLTPITT